MLLANPHSRTALCRRFTRYGVQRLFAFHPVRRAFSAGTESAAVHLQKPSSKLAQHEEPVTTIPLRPRIRPALKEWMSQCPTITIQPLSTADRGPLLPQTHRSSHNTSQTDAPNVGDPAALSPDSTIPRPTSPSPFHCTKPDFTPVSPPLSQPTPAGRMPPWKRRFLIVLLASLTGYVAGQACRPQNRQHPKKLALETPEHDGSFARAENSAEDCTVKPVTDALFDKTDNLCVFWLKTESERQTRQTEMQEYIDYVRSLKLPCNDLYFAYTIASDTTDLHSNEGSQQNERRSSPSVAAPEIEAVPKDEVSRTLKPIPNSDTLGSTKDSFDRGIPFMVYKGQRKGLFWAIAPSKIKENNETSNPELEAFLTDQAEALRAFLTPVSEDNSAGTETRIGANTVEENDRNIVDYGVAEIQKDENPDVEPVTYNTFQTKVLNACSPQKPILLQLMEDSCFLCFLMRPLINTLSRLFRDHNIPLVIKRLNLEKNDFPPGCPIVRSTPNFVLYTGNTELDKEEQPPQPWKEYKPKELLNRLSKEFHFSPDVESQFNAAVDLLQDRFQKIGLLSLWTQELASLQTLHAEGPDALKEKEKDPSVMEKDYATIVKQLMEHDMKRNDTLEDNIVYLDNQIAKVEEDCLTLAKLAGYKAIEDYNGRHLELIKARLATLTPPSDTSHDMD